MLQSLTPHNSRMSFFSSVSLIITCQAGLESLVKKDTIRSGATITDTKDRIIFAHGDEAMLYTILPSSRYANRVYLELARGNIQTFDDLFALVSQIHWRHHIPKDDAIVTEAMSIRSQLSHTPTLQSITKKAIVTQLTAHTSSHHLYEDRRGTETHIQLFLIDDTAYI